MIVQSGAALYPHFHFFLGYAIGYNEFNLALYPKKGRANA